jgi:hypothetical protein
LSFGILGVKELEEKKQERIEKTLKMARYAARLVNEKYFDQVADAIKERNENKFKQICEKARIPKKYSDDIYKGLTAGYHSEIIEPRCWP